MKPDTSKGRKDSAPTAIELFAGVGGFRLGLEASGWKVVWSNQWEPTTKIQHASSCYVAHFGNQNHSNVDIKVAIDEHEAGTNLIPDAQMVVGGFPCQDYSVAKSLRAAKGIEGKKGVLWWEIYRLVSIKKPQFVFLENVDRLLKSPSAQRGRDFSIMLSSLSELGYIVEWRVVNSADFGFPQRRIRVFIVATRVDKVSGITNLSEIVQKTGIFAKSLPVESFFDGDEGDVSKNLVELSSTFNLGGAKSPFSLAGAFWDGQYFTSNLKKIEIKERQVLKDILIKDSEVPSEFWIGESQIEAWEYLKGAKSISRISKDGHAYEYTEGKMTFPENLNSPSRTILTGEGGSTPSRFKHVVRTKRGYRRLVPIELERLSGFPDNWTKQDAAGAPISDTKRAFFIGNALIVGLVERVAHEIRGRIS